MVCNLVTYRARSAVREVGYALGFPRPLVDRVAKALETYDSVMVRRDLEAEGGFGNFFAVPSPAAADGSARGDLEAVQRGLLDGMGQLNDGRGVVPLAPVEAIRRKRKSSIGIMAAWWPTARQMWPFPPAIPGHAWRRRVCGCARCPCPGPTRSVLPADKSKCRRRRRE